MLSLNSFIARNHQSKEVSFTTTKNTLVGLDRKESRFSPNTTNNVLDFISRFRFVICIIVHTRLYSSNILIFSTPFAQTCTRSHLYKPSSPPANHHNLDCHNIQNNSRNNECQPNHQHHASIPLQHP